MWVTKLLISPVKKKNFFAQKRPNLAQILAFLVNLGQAMQAYSMPCWWVGWWLWRAGCISQDTYLLYIIYKLIYLVPSYCLMQLLTYSHFIITIGVVKCEYVNMCMLRMSEETTLVKCEHVNLLIYQYISI